MEVLPWQNWHCEVHIPFQHTKETTRKEKIMVKEEPSHQVTVKHLKWEPGLLRIKESQSLDNRLKKKSGIFMKHAFNSSCVYLRSQNILSIFILGIPTYLCFTIMPSWCRWGKIQTDRSNDSSRSYWNCMVKVGIEIWMPISVS